MLPLDDPALFALALGRAVGWVAIVPIFGPVRPTATGRIGLAIALAIFVSGSLGLEAAPEGVGPFAIVLSAQILYGLLLGWLTTLVISAFEAAGGTIDLLGGFSVGAILDPSTGTSNAVFGRFFQMVFIAAILVSNAHIVIVGGFVRSFSVTGPASIPVIGDDDLAEVSRAVAQLLLSALEIGAPLIGALLLAEVTMAIAARFTPQANIFLLSLPLKAMIVLVLLGNVLIFLPLYTERITERALVLIGGIG